MSLHLTRIIYTLFLVSVLLINSCRVISPVYHSDIFNGKEIIENINSRRTGFETYSARRVTIRIVEGEEEMFLRGSVRMIRDSLILVSINAIGNIEAARILMAPDSIKVVDRINRVYYSGNYVDSRKVIPVPLDFYLVQNIIFADSYDFFLNEKDLFTREKKYNYIDELITVSNYDENSLSENSAELSFQFDYDRDFNLKRALFRDNFRDIFASVSYQSYSLYGDYYLPEDIEVYYISHNVPLKAGLNFGRIEIDQDINITFNVPEKFKKIR
jgi:hypothetical protein